MQPSDQQPNQTPQGWYPPQFNYVPPAFRPAPLPVPYPQAYVVAQPAVLVSARTGLGSGLHLAYAALTLATCGLAAPVWIIHAIVGRNRQ